MTNTETEFTYEIRIPEERVAVLIGTEGATKKLIEEQTGCQLDISKEGDVTITGEDGMQLYSTKDIVKAIGRGFNPRIALLLLKTDYAFELINMTDVTSKSKNDLLRLKGRVIGKGGKSREEIERLTDTNIVVYGKTVGIIGEVSQATIARQAVAMLLKGSMHKTVYHYLERKKKEMLFG
ncbi:RNA-processing protein [Candidatus Woesearchaeota archaeon CG10_big_fil_rev_8_21_14_0_10_32_24]|nr:MAG: RNA-processing protein [Candidatus Woesearchaeota archaeon CG10_big_fil_rev_8_21_14_0_10_32_24]